MAWDNLTSLSWSRTSLVRSERSYEGLFKDKFWKGQRREHGPKLNKAILPMFLKGHREPAAMKQIFCPWVSGSGLISHSSLHSHCGALLNNGNRYEPASLIDFLTASSARDYFDQAAWRSYGADWEWVALLALLKIWTTDLEKVHYERSNEIFERGNGGLKLDRLTSPGGDLLFVEAGSNQERVTSITKYSKKEWTVLLQDSSNEHNGSGQSLSVTLSEGQLCIQDLVCLSGSELTQREKSITSGLKKIDGHTFGNYLTLLLQGHGGNWDYRRTFMMLVAACFKDVEKVSFTVQEPSKGGATDIQTTEIEKIKRDILRRSVDLTI